MEPTEILNGIVAIVTAVAVVFGGLAVGAALKHRKVIWSVEKRIALEKLGRKKRTEEAKPVAESENDLVTASHV